MVFVTSLFFLTKYILFFEFFLKKKYSWQKKIIVGW